MSGFDCLKLNIKYGGEVSFVDESFTYLGGFEKRDMSMDPDLMTWSIFADFPSENGVSAPVENVWYKLANEDLAYVSGSRRVEKCREVKTSTHNVGVAFCCISIISSSFVVALANFLFRTSTLNCALRRECV